MPGNKPVLFELGELFFTKEVLQLEQIKGIKIQDYLDRFQRGDWEWKKPRDQHLNSLMLWALDTNFPIYTFYEVLPKVKLRFYTNRNPNRTSISLSDFSSRSFLTEAN